MPLQGKLVERSDWQADENIDAAGQHAQRIRERQPYPGFFAGGGNDDRQRRAFDVNGPNLTTEETEFIEKEYEGYLEGKRRAAVVKAKFAAEVERRRQEAVKSVQVTVSNVECRLSLTCGLYTLTATIKHSSSETISTLSLGWAFVSSEEASCPDSLPTKHREEMMLRAGDTTVLNVRGRDGPQPREFRICTLVTDVSIIADPWIPVNDR